MDWSDYEVEKWCKEFSDRLKFLLTGKMTQRELAEKIGVTEAALSRYVSWKRVPKATTIAKMAKVLNCDVNYLINFEQEN